MKKKALLIKLIFLVIVLNAGFLLSNNISIANEENQTVLISELVTEPYAMRKLLRVGEIKTIDLTGLATGNDTEHTHVYEKKYDAVSHWEQCFICGSKINNVNHTITTVGTEHCYSGYGNQRKYCTAGCGYNETLTKKSHQPTTTWQTSVENGVHYKYCTATGCGNWTTSEPCKNAAGQRLGCTTGITGTCATCGYNYTNANHGRVTNGNCSICGMKMLDWTVSRQALNESTTRITWQVTPISGLVLNLDNFTSGSCSPPVPAPTYSNSRYWVDGNTYYVQQDCTMALETAATGFETHFNATYTYQGYTKTLHMNAKNNIYPDNNKPVYKAAPVVGNGSSGNFSRKATITATYEDTWNSSNNVVYMRLLDTDGKTVISDWGAASKIGTNWTRVFDIVAEIREQSNVYLQAKDAVGNTTEMLSIAVQYIDSKAPVFVSESGNSNEWARYKQISYKISDQGIGNIQASFNNMNNFAQANSLGGNNYEITYNFEGDVYNTPVTGALYMKDQLGNTNTARVQIGKLDKTAPTITSTNINNNTVTLTANDRHQTLGEGSGVSAYRYMTSATKLTNPSITETNSTLVTGKVTGTGSFTVNNIVTERYIYVSAVDLVGNIGPAVEVLIPQIIADGQVDLSASSKQGGVELAYNIVSPENKTFKIYQKESSETNFTIIATTNNITYLTTSATDKNAPSVPSINVGEVIGDEIQINQRSIDNGTEYKFFIEACDRVNNSVVLSKSNEVTETITTGVKGYYWVADNREENDFDVSTANYVETENMTIPLEHNGSYIHIKSIDEAGNISEVSTTLIWIESTVQVDPNNGALDGNENTKVLTGLVGKTVDLGSPTRTGYTFIGWSSTAGEIDGTIYTYAVEHGIVTANWQINKYGYRVEYYYNGTRNNNETETGIETYKEQVTEYEPKEFTGYEFRKVENLPLTITEKEENNVIKVYYQTDETQIKTICYYIAYYKDGQLHSYQKVTKDIQVLIPEEIPVDRTLINTTDKFEGYKFEKTEPEVIPEILKNGEIINVYYLSNKSNVTVEYKDKATGESLLEEEVSTGIVGKNYETKAKQVEGYTLLEDELPKNASGKYTDDDQTVTYYYAKNTSVTVKYVEQDTNVELKEGYTIEGYEGKQYNTKSEEIDNYVLVVTPENSSGTMTRETQEVVYEYLQKTKVIVNHIDKLTGETIETVIVEGKVGDTYETLSKDFEGYELVEAPQSSNGTMTKEEIIVNYYYQKISDGVIEKHIDNISGEVLYNEIHKGHEGDEYKIEAKEFEGYDLVEEKLPENSEGVMVEDVIEVKYYYVRKMKVVVNHVDKASQANLVETETIEGHEGDTYNTEAKEFEGYELVEMPQNANGVMLRENSSNNTSEISVTYYYARKSAGVKEQHIDIKSGKVLDEILHEGHEGDKYETKEKEFEGYDLAEVPTNKEGTMTKELIEVKYYYIRKAKVVVEYIDQLTGNKIEEFEETELDTALREFTEDEIVVLSNEPETGYLRKDSTEVIEGHEGDSYKTEEKIFEGYRLIQDEDGNPIYPENKEGIMEVTEENGEINNTIYVRYYYEHEAQVLVKYIDIKSGESIEEELFKGYEGDLYTTEGREIAGYNILTNKMYYKEYIKNNPEILEENEVETVEELLEKLGLNPEERYIPYNFEGKMVREGIEVNYYYIRKMTVKVEYVDKETGKKIAQDVIIEGHEGDTYNTEAKEVKDYVIIKEELPKNAKGEMKVLENEDGTVQTEIVVSYYYEKAKNDDNNNNNNNNNNGNNNNQNNNGNNNNNNSNNNNGNNNNGTGSNNQNNNSSGNSGGNNQSSNNGNNGSNVNGGTNNSGNSNVNSNSSKNQNSNNNTGKTDNNYTYQEITPSTGDIIPVVTLSIIAIIVLVNIVLFFKNRKRNNKKED